MGRIIMVQFDQDLDNLLFHESTYHYPRAETLGPLLKINYQ